jgi:hypothetical protein
MLVEYATFMYWLLGRRRRKKRGRDAVVSSIVRVMSALVAQPGRALPW